MRDLLFSGKNRTADLGRLKRAYDDVAAAAEGFQRGRPAGDPVHRIALIHAERGLGKTRLAMELYRHLTLACDPHHYWPQDHERGAERLAVMPAAEACNYSVELPFLWCGLAVADGPNPGNTLFGVLEDLLPHLTAARLAGQRRESSGDLARDAADLAFDIGIEIANAAVEVGGHAVGLGMLKRIGQSIWTIGKIVKKHNNDKLGNQESASDRIDSVVAATLDDLDLLFAPKSPIFCGRPLVVLVDDAQFADRDPATAAFLEKLIGRSARECWPVLLIITHWSRNLHDVEAADGTRRARSAIAGVLDRARSGGTLAENCFLEIDLGDPVDDLRPAFVDRFPGIAADAASAIVERAGGNPRKLEQIMARMDRKPAWFAKGDVRADLLPAGRVAVMALSDLPIDEIVLDRFRDAPDGVRSSLMLAGLMGSRFVVDLVDRLSQARFGASARGNVEKGELSYRFVRDAVDRSRDDIAFFAERLFIEASEEYRRSGLAAAEIAAWPGDEELFASLNALLDELVLNPAAFGTLSFDDMAVALALAADRMQDAGSPKAGLALAQLVRVENRRGNPEGAYAAADRFLEGFRA